MARTRLYAMRNYSIRLLIPIMSSDELFCGVNLMKNKELWKWQKTLDDKRRCERRF